MPRNFSLGPHSPVSDFSYETWKVVITQNLHELRLGSPLGGSIIFSLKKIPNNTSRDFCCRKMNGREMFGKKVQFTRKSSKCFFLSKTKISFDLLNNCFKNFSFIWSDLGFCIYASGTKGISMRVHVVRSICTFAIVFISNYFQAA